MTPTRPQVQTLLRLRWVAIASIPGVVGGLAINAWLFPTVFAPQAMALGMMLATELVCASLPRRAAVARRAVPLAVAYTAVHGLGVLWLQTWSPVYLDLAAGTLAALLTGVALLFPWGGATQVGVTLLFATSFAVVVPWRAWDDGRVLNILIQLAVGGIISIAGAVVVERQRAATERERAHTREVARQRAGMLVAAHELNATLDLETLGRRIVRVARTLIACDVSSLTLIDTQSGRVVPTAMDGDIGATGQSLVGVVFTDGAQSPYVQELLTHLATRATVLVPGGTSLDGPVHAVLQHFGVARALFVAIRREGRVLGYMSFNWRDVDAGFDAQDLRLAEGLAQSAAIALDNARLVDDLQRAGRLKSEFVSTMSHELRTPLNVIIGYTDMLDELDGSAHATALERIRGASRELLELIEATLNLSRLESGHDLPHLEPVALDELWDELAQEFAALPRPTGVGLRWEAATGGPVHADRRKVRIIVKNLVGNALKFTPTGEVVASCDVAPGRLRIVVRDTGVGIRADQLPVIFEMFRQVDSSDSRSYGGVGLGLHIVHRLCGQLGGTVAVVSAPGQGSTFTVTLPTHEARLCAISAA
ncbi:MAG TPA: GAF domain-containing sensor histidine kinase [Candidatus Binatia bacterium]|jgi:signal transduction histidine kinase|nr:GAF domain-containing sensor histidine kinase [Candidatus Binatia bacterium]